ncbi:hypothetical protein DYU05_12825 [Mucilaginibacter terrenus]|uniref:Fumarate hydratase n=1 Tax=Mucilaginibacter terrenus TaxID=2482727 RepID=A0A3E2NQ64_9SPHI|nr:hypothetical protein [Mucilaginibacter terrenus]RFZ83030.1 hypothetical protein DYU05_12825 [Mucilaginibacter terrenus]
MQKRFVFFRSPFLLTLAFCLLLSALSFPGCKFNPDYQEQGQQYLQGEWLQDTSALQKQLVTATAYRLKFSCDSFFVSMNSFSKAVAGADTCIKNGHWAEFAKGIYQQKHDTLILKGLFCNPNFSYKVEGGCFRYGNYQEAFKVKKQTDSIVRFAPLASVLPFNARLIKRNTCIPKPL